jgi:polyisoprenoid-binding protein YceI
VIALVLAGVVQAEPANYRLSGENTKIEFVGTKKDGAHTGSFPKLSGTATANDADPATLKLMVLIDVNSMQTDAAKLTAHLKSPDFFDVKRYPEAKFVSTAVAKGKSGYTVTGNLTLHGETKKLSFPADIALGPDGLKLTAKFKLNRNDWGITYGKGQINDDVAMTIGVATEK